MQSWALFTEGRRDIFSDPVLNRVAVRRRMTPAQAALRYLIQNGIPVIPKSSRPERMAENLATADVCLDPEDMDEISELDGGRFLFGWYR